MSDLDYVRVEKAIRYLEQHARRQPELAEVAAAVGLSEYHFQRLFRRWAGVSPKRFLQFLTAGHARALLRDSATVLEASYQAGLSGPGRLHDLLVSVDAATPGEVRRSGAGLEIRFGYHPTPFGECLLAATERGVCALSFVGHGGREGALAEVAGHWSAAALREDPDATAPLAARAFDGGATALHLGGTNFQLKVWEALLRIEPGTAATYQAVAAAVGSPGAVRAVGSATASNPVAYLIPCHRVIRKSGAFGEYRWGAERKRAMLGWEAARSGGVGLAPRAGAM